MLIESHRGWATHYPENTMISFAAAQAEGYDMIELDPRFTSDHHCVILHDPSINRTGRDEEGKMQEEKIFIKDITLAEAQQYEYGSWYAPQFKGEKLPELKEVMTFAAEKKIPLKFDNVWHHHPDNEPDLFLAEIAASPAKEYCEITCLTIAAVEKAVKAINGVKIHYDGMWNSEVKEKLSRLITKDRLIVWRRMDNKRTAWCQVPPITVEDAADIHEIANLGLWLLTEQDELEKAKMFNADVIETDGSIKPEKA